MGLEDLLRDLYPGKRELSRLAGKMKLRMPGWVEATVPMLLSAIARTWEVRHLRPEALSGLSEEERGVLGVIGALGGVADETDVGPAVAAGVVERLLQDAWLFPAANGASGNGRGLRGARAWVMPEPLAGAMRLDADGDLLGPALLGLPPSALRRLQASLKVEAPGRTLAVARLRRELLDPGTISKLLSSLRPDERELLDRFVAAGGWLSMEAARGDAHRRGKSDSPSDEPVARLCALGLAFVVADLHGDAGAVLVPPDLLASVRAADPSRGAHALRDQCARLCVPLSGAETVVRRGTGLLDDLRLLVSLVEGGEWSPTQQGGPRAADLKRLEGMLAAPASRDYAAFLWRVAEEAGAVACAGGRYTVGGGAERLLVAPRGDSLRSFFRTWGRSESWTAASNASPTWADGVVDPARLRKGLWSALRATESGAWVSLRSLTEQLYERGLHPHFGSDRGKSELTREVEAIVAGPANWLGALDVAYLPDASGEGAGRPTAVQLTALGAWLLGAGEAPPDAAAPQERTHSFYVEPNFDVVVPPGLDPELLRRLARFCRPGAGGRYQLDAETVRAALDHGETTASLLTFLRAHASSGLPENVAAALSGWSERHGEVEVFPTDLVVVSRDAGALARLLSEPGLAGKCTRICEHALAVSGVSSDPSQLVSLLRKRGFWAVSGRKGA